MSETSSDTESSCGWTIISNEGSDIEILGSEPAIGSGAELECSNMEELELLESQASASAALSVEEKRADSLDNTLGEQMLDETLYAPEVEDYTAGKEQVLFSSDHSDIVTLGDLKDGEQAEGEATASEELYHCTPCSSHYAFTASDKVFPVQQPAVTNSSSSEDEAGRSAGTVIRRRRVRKNTANTVTEEEEEEEVLPETHSSEGEEKEEVAKEQERTEGRPTAPLNDQGRVWGGSILNKCILLALIVAISMGLGHFYATVQIQDRQKTLKKVKANELDGVRDLLQQHVREQHFTNLSVGFGQDSLDEQQVISLLAEMIEKIKKENKELNVKQVHIQAQRDNLEMLLKDTAKERTNAMSQQQSLKAENRLMKSSLEREEKSLSILQEELRNLRSKLRDLEAMGAGTDSLLSENQRLKDQLEEEKNLIRNFHVQREDMMSEAQMLRIKLDKERRVTEELRTELRSLRSRIPEAGKEGGSEAEELQLRLMELERKLSFEQQRSDLWERLYVETKEERAKGDRESKVKKPKEGMAGKVKETFDAVKNSTKEFVHHHKEQIKKAKEAVKENLRKFSDSVKSTFQNFKDSASTFINKARGFYKKRHDKKYPEESWHHRPLHRQKSDFSQSNHNTRKSGGKVHEDQGHNSHKASMKGCTGVFDCAYLEYMNIFNKAMEPIRADEFYQLLQSYLQQEVEHFHHWKELERFINNFFHNGVFIHDQMLFTDFVSEVEDYLTDMHEYHVLDDDVFGDLDDYIYRHFFWEAYIKSYGPRGPFERPEADLKEEIRAKHQQRKQQRARSRSHSERKWSRSQRNADRHMADVKIELGPMPFDPKY
ncbi:cell cycle progression protein 1 [Melanotaenia boesemani]|uniref:cell cycle progression protein 1 n=1 Tax=Melanotaenia boesemani TaxID=1250792 RepID=UPI001C044314|nr:cell cycle progression protein 1 [Melanotaenia boesemani]XP_041839986.1 cell cycle progression protein 1 [Melanotaenia boesemani]